MIILVELITYIQKIFIKYLLDLKKVLAQNINTFEYQMDNIRRFILEKELNNINKTFN